MGGRIYQVIQGPSKNPKPGKERLRLVFDRNRLDTTTLKKGDRIWKTSDPALEKQLRQTYEHVSPQVDYRSSLRSTVNSDSPWSSQQPASGAIARSLSETPFEGRSNTLERGEPEETTRSPGGLRISPRGSSSAS